MTLEQVAEAIREGIRKGWIKPVAVHYGFPVTTRPSKTSVVLGSELRKLVNL